MNKTYLITTGLAGSLFLISCEPLPVGPPPGYGERRVTPYDQRHDHFDRVPYQSPEEIYGGGGRPLPPGIQAPPQQTRDQYPTAERTDNPDQVLSPYAPYNVIDVEGFRTGQLAKDPSNGKIFRVP